MNITRVKIIADYLEEIKHTLPSIYPWNPNLKGLYGFEILSQDEQDFLGKFESNSSEVSPAGKFEKELGLKKIVKKHLHHLHQTNKTKFIELAKWIIKDWGGISGGNETDKLIEEIVINKANISFDRIASSSKVGAFMFPEELIIYDSRVAYSLNWILLKNGESSNFFPIPDGRNSKMMAFDMNVLIRLGLKDKYNPTAENSLANKKMINTFDRKVFIDKKQAYKELNLLIKQVHQLLWENKYPEELYRTEMLLFSISDNYVYEDILKSVEFSIHN